MIGGVDLRRCSSALAGGGRALLLSALLMACEREKDEPGREPPAAAPSASVPPGHAPRPLELLHLEDAPALPPTAGGGLLHPPFGNPIGGSSPRCPSEMVQIRGEYCIDRFEVTLVEEQSERTLSPFYHPTRAGTVTAYERYRDDQRTRSNAPSFPEPPGFQLDADAALTARSLPGVVPQGYLNARIAESACARAGKRLCSLSEWITACRGQQNRKFPYGESFTPGKCNVFRAAHPAVVLHRDASRHHQDPRLNLVSDADGPLLRKTGQTWPCRSEWGNDAVFDMVGNLDEWIQDGSFVGGFYARATREGCDARISSHAPEYFDYSLGTRCCRSF